MKALVCGVGGQDGAYLARLLCDKGYEVWGTSRDAQMATFVNLNRLQIREKVVTRSMATNDFRSVMTVLHECNPDEVYFLAGQSSVGLSFEQPVESLESNTIGVLNLMEAIRLLCLSTRLYHASTSESFGDIGKSAANENTPFAPRSPYAVAKASAHWLVTNYRESYGLHACNGILFNHESPLRPERFVTQKIVSGACRIAQGSGERIELGRLDIVRDWGWAPEYVEGMWRILQQDEPRDYVLATGQSCSLESFVSTAFEYLNMDWREHVVSNPVLFRPTDLSWSQGDPSRVAKDLGWSAKFRMHDVVREMILAWQEKHNHPVL